MGGHMKKTQSFGFLADKYLRHKDIPILKKK